MKGLILGLGRFFVDLGAFIQLLIVIALSITAGVATGEYGFIVGILTFLVLFIIFILSNYLFYLFLGMHDSQASMAKSLDVIARNFALQNVQNNEYSTVLAVSQCPNCGAKINAGDTFCGECGKKLD